MDLAANVRTGLAEAQAEAGDSRRSRFHPLGAPGWLPSVASARLASLRGIKPRGLSIGRARRCDTVKVPTPALSSPHPLAGDDPQGTDESRETPMPEPEPVPGANAEDEDAETPTTAETETGDPAVYPNRAARRAKGKVASPQPSGKGQRLGGRGSVESPRQWGNRRSG